MTNAAFADLTPERILGGADAAGVRATGPSQQGCNFSNERQ